MKSLLERAYENVCHQPGHTADTYLKAMKASIRSGGCFTMLERCGYIRFEVVGGIKNWYPVFIEGKKQILNLNHPLILEARQAQKNAQMPENKYGIVLGEFLQKIVKSDFLTQEKKMELFYYVIEHGYMNAICWKDQGFKTFVEGAELTLRAVAKANEDLEKLANENYTKGGGK